MSLLTAPAALADNAEALPGHGEVDLRAVNDEGGRTTTGGGEGGGAELASDSGGGGSDPCEYVAINLPNLPGTNYYPLPAGYHWVGASCPDGVRFIPAPDDVGAEEAAGGGGIPLQVLITRAREEALDRLQLPRPEIAMNPPDKQYTQMPTWLHLAGGLSETSATASAGPVSITATAVPTRVVWDLGNGDEVVCEGPGTKFRPAAHDLEDGSPDCGYTYRQTSWSEIDGKFTIEATIHWDVSLASQGAAGAGGSVPSMTSTDSVEVEVTEIQTVLVPNGEAGQ